MHQKSVIQGALACMAGMLLARFPGFVAENVRGEVPVTWVTGALIALFFTGVLWNSLLNTRILRITSIACSAIAIGVLVLNIVRPDAINYSWILIWVISTGSLFGTLINKTLSTPLRVSSFTVNYLTGIALGHGLTVIPDLKSYESIVLILIILLCSALMLIEKEENHFAVHARSRYQQMLTGLYWGIICFEVIFWSWSAVLFTSKSQKWPLDLVLAAGCLFFFRILGRLVSTRKVRPGYLFILSILLMLGLGMFYTLPNPVWFALSFGLSVGVMLPFIEKLTPVQVNQRFIRVLGIVLSASAVMMGFYLENHFEYIADLGLPNQVWMLSARQAWIKEAAMPGGISVLITGYLYLYRKRWWLQKQ
jgi:hypothetical protein